ncbi:MAG: CARDB domain-containing protein [Thermoplasmatota archaeon]
MNVKKMLGAPHALLPARRLITVALLVTLVAPSISVAPSPMPAGDSLCAGGHERLAAPEPQSAPWPMYMRDAGHTSDAGTFARKLTDPLVLWSTDTSIESATMTVGNFTRNIMLNATSEYGRRTLHTAFVEGGQVTLAEAATGALMWQAPLPGTLLAAPTISDLNSNGKAELIVVSSQGAVTCYEPILEWNGSAYSWNNTNLSAQRVWERQLGGEVLTSSPAVGDVSGDGLPDVALCAGGTLYVLHGTNGTVLWSASLPGNMASSPVLLDYGGGGLWVAAQSFNGTLTPFFMDRTWLTLFSNRGLESWNKSASLSTTFTTFTSLPSPASADLTGDGFPEILFASPFEGGSGVLYALKQDGSLCWSPVQLKGQCEAPPATGDIDGDSSPDVAVASWNFTLVTGNARVTVSALNGSTGKELWSRTLDRVNDVLTTERAVSAPALADLNRDGRSDVVLTLWNGRIEALSGAGGGDLWTHSSGRASVFSSPSIADAETDGFPEVLSDGVVLAEKIGDLALTPEDIVLSSESPREGDVVQLTAFVRNIGTKDLSNVSVLFTDIYDGEEAWSNRSTVNVSARGSAGATVTWLPAGGGRHVLSALADPEGLIEEVSELNNGAQREASVSSQYTLSASCAANESYINAGEEAAYFVEVRNDGCVTQNISLSASRTPAHWSAAVDPARVSLDPGRSASALVTVNSPSNATAGPYAVSVTARSEDSPANRASVVLTTYIRGQYGVRVSPRFCSTAVTPDDWALFRITVANMGNAADTIVFDNSTPPTDWRVFLSHYSAELEGGAEMVLSATVRPPPYATEGDSASINLLARSSGDPLKTDAATLQVVVAVPDLVVEGLALLRADGVEADGTRIHLVDNGSARAVVGVRNARDNVAVGGVRVALEEGEIALGQENIAVLERGVVGSVEIPWRPSEGTHQITALVDPQDSVGETDESNNRLEREVVVKSRYPSGPYLLSGTVYKRGGAPVSGGTVLVSNLRTGQNASLGTDSFGRYSIELSGMVGSYWEEDRVMVTATDGLTTCSTVIYVYSEDGGKTVDLHLLPGLYDFFVAADRTATSADPGVAAAYKVWLTNLGSSTNTLVVNYSTPPQGWVAVLEDESGHRTGLVTLAPNATGSLELRVTPPTTAHAGSRAGVRVTAVSANDTSVSRYIDTVTTVNQVFGLELSTSSPQPIRPGGAGRGSLALRNGGNGNDTFDLNLTVPAGLAAELERSSAELGPFEELELAVNITASLTLSPGSYNITALARSRYSPRAVEGKTELRVIVEPFVQRVVVTGGAGSIQQEDYGSVNFTVMNTGNVRGTFLLRVAPDSPSELSPDWSFEILKGGAQVSSVGLDEGESARLELRVDPPLETPGLARVNFNVTASSATDPAVSSSSILSLAIERPDLYIEKSVRLTPSSPRAGERVRLVVTLRNQGYWDSPPVVVRFYSGAKLLAEATSLPVEIGASVDVSADWVAIAGPHTIKAVVNPEHPHHARVRELSYQNNEVTRYLVVEEAQAGAPWGLLAAVGAALALIVGGAAWVSRRRRSRISGRGGDGDVSEEGEIGGLEEGGDESEEGEGSDGRGAEGKRVWDGEETEGEGRDRRGGGGGEEEYAVVEVVEEGEEPGGGMERAGRKDSGPPPRSRRILKKSSGPARVEKRDSPPPRRPLKRRGPPPDSGESGELQMPSVIRIG